MSKKPSGNTTILLLRDQERICIRTEREYMKGLYFLQISAGSKIYPFDRGFCQVRINVKTAEKLAEDLRLFIQAELRKNEQAETEVF